MPGPGGGSLLCLGKTRTAPPAAAAPRQKVPAARQAGPARAAGQARFFCGIGAARFHYNAVPGAPARAQLCASRQPGPSLS
ncbi:hypothetical protein CT19431_40631 [Cupriavidus taiwanensis]|nr:hypothetical protein CT19431_40631 [Cupriavidus taiwanensis]